MAAGEVLIGTVVSLPSPEIAEIMSEIGFDWLFFDMDKAGQVTDPEVLQAMDHVRTCCTKAGIRLGIFGVNAAAVEPFIQQGFRLIAVGTDTMFLCRTARKTLSGLGRRE